jgi:hypothetical protein
MPPTRKTWLVGGLIAGLFVAPVALLGCAFVGGILWAGASFGDRDPAFTQNEAEAFIGTRFPASARNYDGYQEGFQDGFFMARVEIAPGDEAAFFAKTPFAKETGNTTDNPFERADPNEPEQIEAHGATSYEWFSRDVPGANEILFFDRSDPKKTVIIWRRLEM